MQPGPTFNLAFDRRAPQVLSISIRSSYRIFNQIQKVEPPQLGCSSELELWPQIKVTKLGIPALFRLCFYLKKIVEHTTLNFTKRIARAAGPADRARGRKRAARRATARGPRAEEVPEAPAGLAVRQAGRLRLRAETDGAQEVINTPFCPSEEKFHTFVLRGVRNIW